MSKAVRIREHLYDEIERLAREEKRSLISQLEILLEQALKMDGGLTERDESGREGHVRETRVEARQESLSTGPRRRSASSPASDPGTPRSVSPDLHFKPGEHFRPDPKPGKR